MAFREYWTSVEHPVGSVLAYNTGRCYTQYSEGMRVGVPGMHLGRALHGKLPTPDVLISGDGTEVRWLVDAATDELAIDTEWLSVMREHWWSSGLRAAVIARMGAEDEELITNLNDAVFQRGFEPSRLCSSQRRLPHSRPSFSGEHRLAWR